MSKPRIKRERAGGYTLLEIVGVLLLIGLIMNLAQPNFFRVEERNRMRYVGELLQTDLQRVQAETQAGNRVKLHFTGHGYYFTLGEILITRDYRVCGITFSGATAAATEDQTEAAGGASDSDRPTTINWESKHYQGALALTPDGAVRWGYHEK
jgi:Tfp pilus assembly protein FimT